MTQLLPMSMHVAVPVEIDTLLRLTKSGRSAVIRDWVAAARELIPASGDALLYKSKDPPTAKVFAATARAVAALAFSPGGVHVFGRLWCAEHYPLGTTPDHGVCDQCCDLSPW